MEVHLGLNLPSPTFEFLRFSKYEKIFVWKLSRVRQSSFSVYESNRAETNPTKSDIHRALLKANFLIILKCNCVKWLALYFVRVVREMKDSSHLVRNFWWRSYSLYSSALWYRQIIIALLAYEKCRNKSRHYSLVYSNPKLVIWHRFLLSSYLHNKMKRRKHIKRGYCIIWVLVISEKAESVTFVTAFGIFYSKIHRNGVISAPSCSLQSLNLWMKI